MYRVPTWLATWSLMSLSAVASAESTGVALNQFEPSPAGDSFESLDSAQTAGHLQVRGKLGFNYAKDPLVLVDQNGDSVGAVVSGQGFLHAGASLSLFDRMLVGVDLPVALLQSGDDPSLGGVTVTSPSKAGLGDLRLTVRGRAYGEYWDPIQISAQGRVYVPTGPKSSYIADGSVYGGADLLVSGRLPYFVWSVQGGATLHASSNPTRIRAAAGAGVSLLDDNLQIGPEAVSSFLIDPSNLFEDQQTQITRQGTMNAEVLFGAHYRFLDDFVAAAAGGTGLTNGVGTPKLRVLASFSYTPRPDKDEDAAPKDSDGDGIADALDACPDKAGKANDEKTKNGCPGPKDSDGDGVYDDVDACPNKAGSADGCPDRDGDGIRDTLDACPSKKGNASSDEKQNGCPKDSDGDGVYDPDDGCPKVPGLKDAEGAKRGCPPDDDNDGIPNAEDKCPDVRGKANTEEPDRHGCPKDVRVTETEIVILKKIRFAFGKAGIEDAIDPVSDALLEEVRTVIEDHPEIEQVEVEGHTDSKGKYFFNMKLSQARAESVKQWLVKKGIPESKLVAKGYGPMKPIGPNYTSAGREQNRRVGFRILKRKK